MKKIIIILTALLIVIPAWAQISYSETNNLFYHTQRTPQTNLLNPALFPTNNTFYLMLPNLTTQFGIPLSIKDIVRYDAAQDANIINVDQILQNLSGDNPFRLGLDVGILGFGFKAGDFFFDFNTQLKTTFTLGLTGEIVNALTLGNMDENGNAIKEVTLLSGDVFNTQAYLETSVGAGYHIDPINLTVGVHAKLLSGIFNIQTDNTHIYIETDENFEKVTAHVYYQAMESSAIPIDTASGIGASVGGHIKDAIACMIDPFGGNTGLAFDIGARYDLGPFSFSASINDLSSGIHWQNNVNSVVPSGGEGIIEFQGIELSNMLSNGNLNTDSLRYMIEDQIKGMLPEFRLNSQDYWYYVPTKVNLGINYNFAKILRAGVLFHGQFDRGLLSKKNANSINGEASQTFRFNTTVSAGLNLFNWAEFIAASSIVFDGSKPDFFNPGVGIILTPGTFLQAYIMADYVSSIYITEVKAINLKLGVNLLFGNGGRKTILDN